MNWDMGTNERPNWKAYLFCAVMGAAWVVLVIVAAR